MKCATWSVASLVGVGALLVMSALAACRDAAQPEVPGVTTALPSGSTALASDSDAAPGAALLGAAGAGAVANSSSPATVVFLEGTKKLEPPLCSRLFIVAVRGSLNAGTDSLAQGDTLVIVHPEPVEVKVPNGGLALQVIERVPCAPEAQPLQLKKVVAANAAPPLAWLNGTMRAHLDVGTKLSPNLYLGRLEGTAAVAEHEHATSSETLVAIEASGTFTIDGKDVRVGPRQIVRIPRGTKHAWKPDPGTKLVAVQMYEPPGPEQRFVALAAAAHDAGVDASSKRP